MIHLALQTEYSFKECYGRTDDIVKLVAEQGCKAAGIADLHNTLGHVSFTKACKKYEVKPIYGVRLHLVPDEFNGRRFGTYVTLIAKCDESLSQLYQLVSLAWDNFYYIPKLYYSDLLGSDNIPPKIRFKGIKILNPYLGITSEIKGRCREMQAPASDFFGVDLASKNLPLENTNFYCPILRNFYPKPEDKKIYQLLCGTSKRGDSYIHKFNMLSNPQHILTQNEIKAYFSKELIDVTYDIANQCNATIPLAPMVKYNKPDCDIDLICKERAKELDIDLELEPYKSRYEKEIKLIEKKNYSDYFLVVSDMIKYAKKDMLVGPSRGSSAGSLVCYLMRITEVDPIKYGLIFERFIDINREDLPDIDVDFPDKKRNIVIKYLVDQYGKNNVKCLSNISKLKPKSAIDLFTKGLGIQKYKAEELKNSIVERSSGDARAALCLEDTLNDTEPGKIFLENYPEMKLVMLVENHATHSGKHAAGIIVSNDELTKYSSLNSRDETIMLNKKDAEYINLLKIDCLGLRTLTIIEEVCDQIKMPYESIYSIPLDDKETFDIFNDMRLNGIFQFEGQALRFLTKQMGCHIFDDLVAITALGRPGPLNSGGAGKFVKRRTGQKEVKYISNDKSFVDNTKDTYGIIIYQEQIMNIANEYGSLSWEDVSTIRKIMSASLGEEFFNKYEKAFVEGALKRGKDIDEIMEVWNSIMTFGSWGFNKSHAVSYALISYWTAYFKAHYPLEFAVATLNNSRGDEEALKILRDMVKVENIEYIPFDMYNSGVKWSVYDGKLLGGLTNIDGIGIKKAEKIVNGEMTPSMYEKLKYAKTNFDILFPTEHHWGHLYNDPKSYGLSEPPNFINDVEGKGKYTIIGKLRMRDLRNLNDYNERMRRGGEFYKDNFMFLRLLVEDDTDQIMCNINRFNFEELDAQSIAETSKVDETWFLIRGKITGVWRIFDIDHILNLNDWEAGGI